MPGPIDVEVEPRAGPSTNRPGCTFRWVNARRTKRKSSHGHADAARALLERGGANPEVANSQEGLTPLMMASKYGHIGVVISLLDAGARIDARDRDGRSAEDVAAELGRQSVLELLRDARRAKGEL